MDKPSVVTARKVCQGTLPVTRPKSLVRRVPRGVPYASELA